MALEKRIEFKGVVIDNAYMFITDYTGIKDTMGFHIGIAKEKGAEILDYRFHACPVSVEEGAVNFVKQAYLHLKTLPEYADAIDC